MPEFAEKPANRILDNYFVLTVLFFHEPRLF